MAKSDDLKDGIFQEEKSHMFRIFLDFQHSFLENLDPRKLVGIPASATAWQAHMGHQEEGSDRVESKIKILALALE